MARKRMLDPHFWESAQDKGWTVNDCVLMMAAISIVDDEGRGRISELKHIVEGIIHLNKFQKSIRSLRDSIVLYRKIYFILPNFKEYQKISHPSKSKIPEPTPLEIKTYLENLPELIQNDSTTVKVSLNEFNLNEFKGKNGQLSNSQLSNVENSLPLLTDISDYQPEDYKNQEQVTHSIRNLLTSFCNIEDPDKSTISSFVNIVLNTNQVKNQTAFKYVFDTFLEFHSYSDEKRNLKYLYSRVKGRIDDALIRGREEKAKLLKQKEKAETVVDVSEDISQLANKIKIN